jgi:hypothetical protein
LQWIVFTDEQNVDGGKQAGLNEEVVKNYTDMGSAIRSGEMTAVLLDILAPFTSSI